MDNKKPNDDKLTPGKSLRNILFEKTTQGKLAYSFNCDSPFRCMPSVSTPPSSVFLIKNPFEGQLSKRLHCTVFSPNVFNLNVTSNAKTEKNFKWNIEDISNLKPADIDESTINRFESIDSDPDMEKMAQSRIDTFFSEKHIVPSPFDIQPKTVRLISESTSPIASEQYKQTVDGTAQTILTLPPKLPEQVEAILKPYFSYTVNQQRDESNKNASLYRRLFEYDEQNSPNSVLTSPAPSCNLSPIEFSPYNENQSQFRRNFGSPDDNNHTSIDKEHISDCNLSPISLDTREEPLTPTSMARSNFMEHMSIDTSLNLVPDTLDQMPPNNQSVIFESMHSPIPEALSDSSVNWDIEYKHVSLISPNDQNKTSNQMEISNYDTPKSKIFTSQRKKLSESFLNPELEDKENIHETNMCTNRKVTRNLFFRNDTGYHTGGLTMCEESWSSSNLFASTPTSKK